MSLFIILYLSFFSKNLLYFFSRLFYTYILIIKFWHSTSVNVRFFYRFWTLILWMLSSLFLEETMRVMNDMHKNGLFAKLGLSNFSAWEVARYPKFY